MDNQTLSLFELNNIIKGILTDSLPQHFWIRAETSDVRVNQNGHCYLEFIEKDSKGQSLIAKSRAMIWSNTFYVLRAYFENATGQAFSSGLKVLVQVSVEFHELYGFSLTVQDIDPSYTLGDQARNRALILKQLEEDGVIDLNKELELPQPTNRIAIISSPTAAGYEDFCDQLAHNAYGFAFYTKLFPAIMQGDRAADSIISALEHIYEYQDCFDVVVIIRGGGATSDLNCFDSYLLAASCAQFPLPIITGIGHERDETVLDIVAHTRAKTPTAVAEFLIANLGETALFLSDVANNIGTLTLQKLQEDTIKLNTYLTQVTFLIKNRYKEQNNHLAFISSEIKKLVNQKLKENKNSLDVFDKHLQLISPENILKKGYTLTLKDGKIIKQSAELKKGDEITTLFHDGEKESTVK